MAQPRRKGKSKQKNRKPTIIIETDAKKAEEAPKEAEVQESEVKETKKETKKDEQTAELSTKEQKKLLKEQAKKDKLIAKQKAEKKRKEADEKAGKIGLKQRFKETGSELKKISWPSFKETMKKTGVVIAVVLFFAVVLIAFDFGLSELFKLLVPK